MNFSVTGTSSRVSSLVSRPFEAVASEFVSASPAGAGGALSTDGITQVLKGGGNGLLGIADAPAVGPVYTNLGGMGDADVGALCTLVMMEAAKSARDDLKEIMAGVKAIDPQSSPDPLASRDGAHAASLLGGADSVAAADVGSVAGSVGSAGDADGGIFAVMLEYQKVMSKEAREDVQLSRGDARAEVSADEWTQAQTHHRRPWDL